MFAYINDICKKARAFALAYINQHAAVEVHTVFAYKKPGRIVAQVCVLMKL